MLEKKNLPIPVTHNIQNEKNLTIIESKSDEFKKMRMIDPIIKHGSKKPDKHK